LSDELEAINVPCSPLGEVVAEDGLGVGDGAVLVLHPGEGLQLAPLASRRAPIVERLDGQKVSTTNLRGDIVVERDLEAFLRGKSFRGAVPLGQHGHGSLILSLACCLRRNMRVVNRT
jgi:hypothetical protein